MKRSKFFKMLLGMAPVAAIPIALEAEVRSRGEGNGNPLQYSCLENSMDRGAW